MSSSSGNINQTQDFGMRLVYWLTVFMVIVGLVNMTPGIPGYDDLVQSITGIQGATFRKFPFEWFYPLFFALMMLIVALKHSLWRSWSEKFSARLFGLFIDIALVLMACIIAFTYLTEIEAICLIDQVTGDRARLIQESLKAEKELADLLGMEPPTTVDDPKCVNNTGGWIVLLVGLAIVVFLSYNVKVWGLPLVLVAIIISAYTIGTVLVWYFHGPEDINKYFMTKLAGEPRLLSDGRPRIHDILVNNSSGLLGRFMDIVLNTIFPYLVLGSLFGSSAGGRSLIKIAFRWTRNLTEDLPMPLLFPQQCLALFQAGPLLMFYHGRADHSNDAKKRLFKSVRWWSRGGSVFRWVNYASCYGSRSICCGSANNCSLFERYCSGSYTRSSLLFLSIPLGLISSKKTKHQGNRQNHRRYAPR